jgi:hypothetical protein
MEVNHGHNIYLVAQLPHSNASILAFLSVQGPDVALEKEA